MKRRRKVSKRTENSVLTSCPRIALSRKKKAVFASFTTVGFFVLAELFLALVGVTPVLYEEDPFVGFADYVPLFVERNQSDGAAALVTAPNKRSWFNQQSFPRVKPPGTYRIFSVGGSTTYGRPYDDRLSFSGWLREFLEAADPQRPWEVINAGGVSYASYRVAHLMEELVHYEPDLFIIYSGHNEFLERRTYSRLIEAPKTLRAFGGALSRLRLFAAGRALTGTILATPSERHAKRPILKTEVDAMLAHSVGPSAYRRDESWEVNVRRHYRFNLRRMVDIARSAGAHVLLVSPAANLKDISPFKSQHRQDLTSEERRRFDELCRLAEASLKQRESKTALRAYRQAIAIDDRFAEIHYDLGLLLYSLGRFEEAKAALTRAVDEDVCPLRIKPSMRQTVKQVARERETLFLDFARLIERRSPHGIPDATWFLDHVHLTAGGYRLLALKLFEQLRHFGVVEPGGRWNEQTLATVTERVMARLDDEAQGAALRNLAKVLDWAGKVDEAARMARRAAKLLRDDPENLHTLGRAALARGDFDEAIRRFRRALELAPDYSEPHTPLGRALAAKGEFDRAVLHFRRALKGKPDYAEAHYNLANALSSQERQEEAIAHFRKALSLQPDYPEAHNNLGNLFASRGEFKAAIRHFQLALQSRPASAECHYNLGAAFQMQQEWGKAIDHYREAIRLRSNYAEAHENLGSALLALGKTEEAIRHYFQAVEDQAEDPDAHYNLAIALASAGKRDEAIRHYRQSLSLNPNHYGAHSNLGILLMSRHQVEEALRHFQEALRIQPDSAQTHYNFAMALRAARRRVQAVRHLRKALTIDPSHSMAKRYLEKTVGEASADAGPVSRPTP